ncbi:topoisomerase II-associated protein PAT1 [Phlebopus sp. FC_14]|nr:topoisomerase II-associated protein PAT1 [Phlebopus sp. FC_14]
MIISFLVSKTPGFAGAKNPVPMSFFGFETSNLEQDKKKFLEGGLQESEDLAVYTWGEESYDGLGDALVEGGDELNDETFGGTGVVGKDFDFSSQALPAIGSRHDQHPVLQEPLRERTPIQERTQPSPKPAERGFSPLPAPTSNSLESIWDDKSPFSLLPRVNGSSRAADHNRVSSSSSTSRSPFPPSHGHGISLPDHRSHEQQQQAPTYPGINQSGPRTLQEIEDEMRLVAQQARQRQELELRQRERELRHEQQQQQLQAQQERFRLQQLQLQQQEQQLRLHQHVHAQQPTPPPRMAQHVQHAQMPRTQSPRFHQHQQQILMLQQEHERQQQERLKELQERLRMEEIERQLRAQQLSQIQHQPSLQARRQASFADLQALQQRRTHSPAYGTGTGVDLPLINQHNAQYLPQSIQLQQRLLSEMAHVEFMRDMQGMSQVEQEALRAEAMRKIMETERMEEKRRRKAAKIAHMSRYNDLMTQSDKDFITRIQVSQLVTQDPYAEDFYAQVYGAILRSRMGLQPSQDASERVLKFGSSGGVGVGLGMGVGAGRGGGRRQSAMQKMEAQVERIVSNARLREKEKGMHSLHNLQGALGKTSGRSYKAAPRQLLQVDASATASMQKLDDQNGDSNGAVREAAKLGREALGDAAGTEGVAVVRKEPLTHRQVLAALEALYDLVLNIEQLRREQPLEEDNEAIAAWSASYDDLVEQMWVGLKVMVPLETSDPHPFISLLNPIKGKKILPRLSRHIAPPRMLTLLTLLVACFSQLDVVKYAHLLDLPEDSITHPRRESRSPSQNNSHTDTPDKEEVERQTQAFLGSVLQSILPVVAKAELRLVTGILGLFLDRSDVVMAAQTRPGIALLTLFMSRVEIIKQGMGGIPDSTDLPTAEEAQQWQVMFDHLFQLLAPHFLLLFPSTRLALQLSPANTVSPPSLVQTQHPASTQRTDILDQPVWQFLAALALHASPEQQSILVTGLREKVLENVASAQKGWVVDEEERATKLANVNLFLHALGLDSSQISV